MKTSSLVKSLLEEDIKKAGYILDDVTYAKEGSTYVLTVIIDKNGIITLDEKDPIKDSYILDVCSKEKGCE